MMVAWVGDLLLTGSSSKESVLSIWTEARGTSIQGLISLGLLVNSSTISEAEGLLVGVGLQQLRSKEPLKQNLSFSFAYYHYQTYFVIDNSRLKLFETFKFMGILSNAKIQFSTRCRSGSTTKLSQYDKIQLKWLNSKH